MTHPPTTPSAGSADELSILMSIYSADRAQAAGVIGTIGNITVAGISYIAAVGALVFAANTSISVWWLLAVPVPAWGLFLFQLHMGSIMIARTQSILRIEARFKDYGAYAHVPASTLGQNAEERLTNLHVQPKAFWPGGVLSFAIEPLLLGALTVMSIMGAAGTPGFGWGWRILLVSLTYLTLAALTLSQFINQARRLRDTAHLLLT